MSYRPICDVWILGRPKVKYYGAYPSGFLSRARAVLGVGVDDPVLHVCAGKIRDYPWAGLGPNDQTLDMDARNAPDFCQDARKPFPLWQESALWPAVLIDPPYTEQDAARYLPGALHLPTPGRLLRNALDVVRVGGKVGLLHYLWPSPPKSAREVAVIAVGTGRNNRARWFTVFERLS